MTKKEQILRDIADIDGAWKRAKKATESVKKADILDFDGEFFDSLTCLIADLVNVIDPSEALHDYLRHHKTTPDQVADAILTWRGENDR